MIPPEVKEFIENFPEFAENPALMDRMLRLAEEISVRELETIQWIPEIPAGARDFEAEIAARFNALGTRASPLSSWIREHFSRQEDYLRRAWKRFAFFSEWRIPEYDWNDYGGFQSYFYLLRKLDLVEVRREEPSPRGAPQPRRYYGAIEGELDNPAWTNPQGALYPGSSPRYIRRVIGRMTEELERRPTVEELAREVRVNPETMERRLEEWGIEQDIASG